MFRDTVRRIPGDHDRHLRRSAKEDRLFAPFGVSEYPRRDRGVSDLAEPDHSRTAGGLVGGVVDATLGRYAELERFGYHRSSSRDSIEQLRRWPEKPVRDVGVLVRCGLEGASPITAGVLLAPDERPFHQERLAANGHRERYVFPGHARMGLSTGKRAHEDIHLGPWKIPPDMRARSP